MGGGSLLAAYSAAGMASNTPPVTRDESELLSDSAALSGPKVRTLNGWTLPYRLNGDVKEFHLVKYCLSFFLLLHTCSCLVLMESTLLVLWRTKPFESSFSIL